MSDEAKVLASITMSLDGYVTGPNDRLGAGSATGASACTSVVKGDTTFEFVTGGIHDALARARTAAAGRT